MTCASWERMRKNAHERHVHIGSFVTTSHCLRSNRSFRRVRTKHNWDHIESRTLHGSLLLVRQNPGILMPPIGIFFFGFCSSDSRSDAGAAPVCFVFSAFSIFSLSSSAISFLSILLSWSWSAWLILYSCNRERRKHALNKGFARARAQKFQRECLNKEFTRTL